MNAREHAREALEKLSDYLNAQGLLGDVRVDWLEYLLVARDEHEELVEVCEQMCLSLDCLVRYAPAALKAECRAAEQSLELGRAALAKAKESLKLGRHTKRRLGWQSGC